MTKSYFSGFDTNKWAKVIVKFTRESWEGAQKKRWVEAVILRGHPLPWVVAVLSYGQLSKNRFSPSDDLSFQNFLKIPTRGESTTQKTSSIEGAFDFSTKLSS